MKTLALLFVLLTASVVEATPRFYLAPIIGTGSHANPYKADVPTDVRYAAIIPSAVDGSPKFAFALVIVCQTDHTVMAADARYDAFPVNLDIALTAPQRSALQTRLTNRGWTTVASKVVNGVTWRQILRYFGRFINDGDETNGTWQETMLDCNG